MKNAWVLACLSAALSIPLYSVDAGAQGRKPLDVKKARVIVHWSAARRALAIPRDLVIDERGLGYRRRPDGTLQPHGHDTPAKTSQTGQSVSPFAAGGNKRGGGGGKKSRDSTPPTITDMNPPEGATIGESYTFEARVTDVSGVRSVTFKIQLIGSTFVNSFPASQSWNNMWGANFNGFTDGNWKWWVEAKDKAGNSGTSGVVNFNVGTGSANDPVSHDEWNRGGDVQTAAGRLYFEMPDDQSLSTWRGYVCSATVVTDGTSGRSLILTAAHCVYDDINKVFSRNAFFVPNQAATTGSGTDGNCLNDPLGCWVPSFGVVDERWTAAIFPENMAWDYGFYVIPDEGAHFGSSTIPDALDVAAGSLALNFSPPALTYTQALGYSYNQDPKLMYCADNLTNETLYGVNWWLDICGLSGGSSGGPWIQPNSTLPEGSGPIMGINSWGLSIGGNSLPGMAGSKLYGNSASCVFDNAKLETPVSLAEGQAGIKASCF